MMSSGIYCNWRMHLDGRLFPWSLPGIYFKIAGLPLAGLLVKLPGAWASVVFVEFELGRTRQY